MKILSLFDGMACGMLALLKAGIEIESYDAYEIDKYAIQTATHNFPQISERGDVFLADFTQYKGIDLLIGGSPCTYWSIAQKNSRETTASGIGWELFSQYVRAVKDAKPKFFIYENNKSMSSAIRASITQTFGFEPICINSALVSAQNRQRLYWVGKRTADGTYCKVDVQQPQDKDILLKDVLDGSWQNNNFISEPVGVAQRGRYTESGKRSCKCSGGTEQFFEARTDGKSNCVSTVQKDSMVAEPVRVGAMPRPNGELSLSQAFRLYSIEGKSVNITAGGGGAGGKTGLYAIPVEFENGIPTKAISCADGKTYIVYEVKSGLIMIKDKQYPIKLADGYYIIRKLTVSECKRLQTVPEWYKFPVSDTQAYKMLGNGWTVDVIAHILGYLKEEKKDDE